MIYNFEGDIGLKVIWGPLITGGYKNEDDGSGKTLRSTEIIHPDGKVTPGPNLPGSRSSHCQTSYEKTTFIIGKWFFA